MADKKIFLDRFGERIDEMDSASRQAYLQRLIRERGFFETVFNTVDEGILVIDRHLKLRYANRAARELLALPENWSELRVPQLLQGIDWNAMLRPDETSWNRSAREEIEILYPARRFVQFYLTPYPGTPELAAVILRDVTDSRKATLDELEKETVKAVSLLAAGVAHEIGNPLNSLYLNLQILEKSRSGEGEMSPAEESDVLSICKSEVERLDSIIHGFLTAIRPGRPVFAPVDVRELITEVLNFMRPEIESRLVSVSCRWGETIPHVQGDAGQLKQAFYNIIRNAVQAMTNGGTLEIRGSAVPECLTLEFLDSGEGVTPEQMSTMFTAFKTYKSGGNGIGTMIIERVCREHGAEFGLHSEPGAGTSFRIRFPLGAKRCRLLPGTGPASLPACKSGRGVV